MMNVIEGLRASAKGQLKYDLNWKPTAKSLDECTSPPRVSVRGVFRNLRLKDLDKNSDLQITKNSGRSSDIPVLPTNNTPENDTSIKKPNETDDTSFTSLNLSSQSTEVVEAFNNHMDISVAIHHYNSEKKQEIIEKVQSRREKFDEHSRKLQQEKQRELEELQEIKEQQFLKAVEAIQKDERKRTAEVNKRQEKLYQDHQEHAARAVRKVKQAEEWKKKIEEDNRNKQEIEKLEILVQQLKRKAVDVHKSFEECKHQTYLPAATSDVLSEINKILQMSAETVKNAKQNGKASEKDNKLILQFGEIMRNMINKSKLLISEAQAKAEKEQAELEAKIEAEKSRKAAEAQKLAAAQAQDQQQTLQTVAKPKQNSTLPSHLLDCVSENAFKEYSQLEKLLEETSKAADVLISDKTKSTKQYRFDLQKAVTTPVNAISDQSPSHLLDKIQRLTNLLSGKPVQASGKQVSANSHSAGQAYCRDLLARKLVMQGSQQVSTSHNSAFPIAAVAIAISAAFPDVRNLILGHFYKQCPFLVPFYIPKTEGTSDEEYYKSLGYECSAGTVEPQDKFLKRMTGLVRLYAAIISSLPPPGVTDHPFGLELGWTFLARILNIRPRQDFTATAIYEFLDVAGHALQRQYGQQFWKLLHVLVRDYLPKINDVTAPAQSGPVVRLKGFLEGCIKNRSTKIPDGYLMSRWWKSSSGGFGY